jgi:hypothetical protein
VAVLHEDAEYEMLGIEKATNRDYAEALGPGCQRCDGGPLHGLSMCSWIRTSKPPQPKRTSSCTATHFVLATRPLSTAPAGMGVVQKVMDEDGIGLRVTLSYNASISLGVQVYHRRAVRRG